MKFLIDLGPILAFALAWKLGGIYVATQVLIGALWLAVAADYALHHKRNTMLIGTAVIATLVGALTLYFKDPLFIRLKLSIIAGPLGLAFLATHWWGKAPLLQTLMGAQLPLPDAVWRRLNLGFGAHNIACALVNLYAALALTEAAWVKVLLAIKLSIIPLMVLALWYLSPYLKDIEAQKAGSARQP